MDDQVIKRADWVACRLSPSGGIGIVKRVARDGSWADVDWGPWTKRMPTSSLRVRTTIPLGRSGWTVTDETRKRELEGANQ